MKDAKAIRDAKGKLITQKRMMQTLIQDEGFKLLIESLQKISDSAKQDMYNATDWTDFVAKRAYFDGLMALSREVDTIISRGKRAELTSK